MGENEIKTSRPGRLNEPVKDADLSVQWFPVKDQRRVWIALLWADQTK